MKKRSILLLAIAGLAITTACKKKKDEETKPSDSSKPVIETFKVNDKTSDVTVGVGDEIHIDIKVTDDIELSQIKLDIHDAFDGHTHGRVSTSAVPFELTQIIDASGKKEHIAHLHVDIPSNAATGPYHFILKATDKAGKEADFKEIDATINSSSSPVINITSPDPTLAEWDVDKADTLVLKGNISDSDGIESIEIVLEDEEGHTHRISEAYFDFDTTFTGTTTSWDFDELGKLKKYIIAPNVAKHIILIIAVKDKLGNVRRKEYEIHVE